MALTQEQLTASMYFIVGLGTEGGDASYRLSVAGLKNSDAWISSNIGKVSGASGYTLGALQLDLGMRGVNAVGTNHRATAGETAYVNAILSMTSAYCETAEAKTKGLVFPVDTTALRAQLLTRGQGIQFISESNRAAINATLALPENMKWVHQKIDLALATENSGAAFAAVDNFGVNWSEEQQWQAANELAKVYNQSPNGSFKKLQGLLVQGMSFDDFQSAVKTIQNNNSRIQATAAGAIGERFYSALEAEGLGDWLSSAMQKVMASDFDPRRLNTDADLVLASKVSHAYSISVNKDANGNTTMKLQLAKGASSSYQFDPATDAITMNLYRGGKLVGGTCYAHALTGGTTVADAAPATRYSYLSAGFGSLLTDLENAAAAALQMVHADDVIKGVGSLYHSITDIYDQATARIDSLIAAARSLFDGIVSQAQSATDASGNSVLKFSYTPGDAASEALLQKVNKLETFWDGLSQEMQQYYGDPGQQFLNLSLDLSSNLPEENQQATEDLRQLAARALDSAIDTSRTQAPDNPTNITTRRNATVLDVNTDTTNVRPERNAQFGDNSNVSVGPAYVARMSHEMVNSDGLSNTLASANTAGKGRPGNLTPSNTEDIVNAIRGDSMTTTKTVAASIPDGVVSSHYEDIYPPYPGENAVPSHGYGLYNANGERIGYVATENANIGHRDSQGNWVTVHVAQAGKTYLFAKDADGKTVTTEMAPGSGSGTLLVNVKEGPNAEGMLNNGSAGARDPYTDPLVLDEGDDGVRFGGNPVSFDLDGDGREDTLSWTAPTDPVLVYDANGDNRVNDGSELIDLTEDGTPHNLITLDGNGDKILNSDDDAYWQIQIWRDSNADGYASEQERQSLAEAGIVAIDLDPAHYKIGNVGGQTAVQGVEAIYGDGSKKMLWDVDFKERDAVTATTEYYAPGIDRISNGDQTALRITDSRGVAANLAGSAATQAIGGLGDDTLTGTAGDDWLIGSDGADKFQGGAGRDILVIDGEDLPSDIDGGADFDTAIVADDRGVMLNLYSANVEIVYGGYGNDVFVGGGADNYFIAGAAGDDLIVGGSADDALSGDDGDDVVSGGRGDDIIRGQRGDDNLSGGDGGDVLDGGIGHDVLDGGVGDDVFIASGGRDTVIGGAGRDTLQLRGALADYRFVRESGGYVVTDTRNADGTLVTAGNVSDRDGEQHISGIETFSYSSGQMSPYLNIDDVKPTPVADLVAIDGGLPCYIIEAATLTANDLDFQGGPLQISWVGEAIGGSVAMTSGLHTTITFTPTPGYVGPMQFSYRVRDPQGNGGVVIEVPEEPGSASEIKGLVRLVQSDAPSDSDYVKQWHLGAVGALEAWREGYTGEGVKVLVLETSGKFAAYDQVADLNAADLAPNKSATFVDTEYHSTHATQVAGVIGAARNGVGGVGVAYDVTLDSKTIGFNLATMNARFEEMRQYDVVNNSWGFSAAWNAWAEDAGSDLQTDVVRKGIFDAVLNGRNGRGTVLVYGAGNDRGKAFDAGTSPLTANPYSITVAALNRGGDLGSGISNSKPFSNRGANILVTAPGSNIFTTEIQATTNDGNVIGSPTAETQGTSFATPIVSAIAALMLQANSKLSYRDVQTILALTATRNFGAGTQATTTWYSNHASDWNGAGMHYSHDFGFGMVDAAAAVRMAESWTPGTAQPQMGDEVHAEAAALADLGSQVLSFDVTDTMDVEHVMLSLKLDHTRWSDFVVTLVSPTGTRSILLDRLGITASGDQAPNPLDVITFDKELMSTHFRGEGAEGTWQLIVEDKAAGGVGSSAIEASLKVYGEDGEVERYVLTDEYAGGWNLAPTTAKPSELNASAVGSAVRIDLAGGASLVNGKALTVGAGIDTLISGSFNDTLSGGGTNEIIIAGRGKDTVSGMGGADTLYGGKGDDSLDGGSDADRLYGDEDQDTLRGGDGGDRLDGGAGNDSLDGGAGKDLLVAGDGRDILTGGGDGDVFIVDIHGGETVTVTDFNAAAGDVLAVRSSTAIRIDLSNITQTVSDNRLTLVFDTAEGLQSIVLEGVAEQLTGRQLKRFAVGQEIAFNPYSGGYDASTILVEPTATVKWVVVPKVYIGDRYGSRVIGEDYWDIDTIGWTEGTSDDDILIEGGSGTKPAVISDSQWAVAVARLGERRYVGNGGNDSIIGGNSSEFFDGGADNDTILAGDGDDSVYGGDGDDSLVGGTGKDTLTGGYGADNFVFDSGAGVDRIADLDSSDTLRFRGMEVGNVSRLTTFRGASRAGFQADTTLTNGADQVSFTSGYSLEEMLASDPKLYVAKFDSSTQNVVLDGKTTTAQADVIVQEKLGATAINTLGGSDLVYSLNHNALTVDAGEGNDTVFALEGGNVIDGGLGNDRIEIGAATTAVGADTLIGGGGNDYVAAGGHSVCLYGDDLLNAQEGNDVLIGSAGNDTAYGGGGYDLINVLAGTDLVYAGAGNDAVYAGAGDDTVYGDAGNDLVAGEAGADSLLGGIGADTLRGGDGNDTLQGEAGLDVLDGGTGEDILLGGADADVLNGGAGNDSLEGGDGDDTLSSGTGQDWLYGGIGNDVLVSGDDDDVLYGGAGSDIFETGSGYDVVQLDMSSGNDSVSSLTGVDTVVIAGVLNASALGFELLDRGTRVKLSWGSGNSLTLTEYNFSTTFQLDTQEITLRELFEAKGYHPDDSFDYVGNYDTQLVGDTTQIGTQIGGSGDDPELYGGPNPATNNAAYWYVVGRGGDDNLAGGFSGAILDGGEGNDQFLGTNGIAVVRDTFHGGHDTLFMAPGMTPETLRFYRIPNPFEAATLSKSQGWYSGDGTYVSALFNGAEAEVPNVQLPTFFVNESRYIDNTASSFPQHFDTLRIQTADGETTIDIVGYFAECAYKNDIADIVFPTLFDDQGYSTRLSLEALAGANIKGGEFALKMPTEFYGDTWADLAGVAVADYTPSRDGQVIVGGESGSQLKGRVKVFLNGSNGVVVSDTEYSAYKNSASSRDNNFINYGSRLMNGITTYRGASVNLTAIALPDLILGYGGNDTIDAGGAYVETHLSNAGFTRKYNNNYNWNFADRVNGGSGDDVYVFGRGAGQLDIIAIDEKFAGADGFDVLDLSAYYKNEVSIVFENVETGQFTVQLAGTPSEIHVQGGLGGAYQVDRIVFGGGEYVDVADLRGAIMPTQYVAADSRVYLPTKLAVAPSNYVAPSLFAPIGEEQVTGSPVSDLISVTGSGIFRGHEGSDLYVIDTETVEFAVVAMDRGDAVELGPWSDASQFADSNLGYTPPFVGGVTPTSLYLGKTQAEWQATGVLPVVGDDYWLLWTLPYVYGVGAAQRGKLGRSAASAGGAYSIADWHAVSDTSDDISDVLLQWQTTDADGNVKDRYAVLLGAADEWGNILKFTSGVSADGLYGTQGGDYVTDLGALSGNVGVGAPTIAGSDMDSDLFTLGGDDTVLAYAMDTFDPIARRYAGPRDGIRGGGGNDLIDGGAGDDKLWGGEGNDSLLGGVGNDLLDGGQGRDTLIGGAGDDIYVADADDTIQESAEYDLLNAPRWTESIVEISAAEAAKLPRSASLEYDPVMKDVSWVVEDGPDNALRYFKHTRIWDFAQGLAAQGGVDEVRGALDIDLTSATYANIENAMVLGDDAHRLTGTVGANRLTGNGAGSTLAGGAGDDVYVAGSDDVIIEAGNQGRDRLETSSDVIGLADNVEDLLSTGTGLNLLGNDLRNRITGDAGDNLIDGGAGRDTLVGGDGDDTYYVDNPNDVIIELAEGGRDVVYTSTSYSLHDSDRISPESIELVREGMDLVLQVRGTTDRLLLQGWGSGGINRNYRLEFADGTVWGEAELVARLGTNGAVSGTALDEQLEMWAGMNGLLDGKDGQDRLTGASGYDTLNGGAGYDTLSGGGGNDVLLGDTGYDELYGGDGADSLAGDAGNDVLRGGSGNDSLYGGADDDWLRGEEGDDSLAGGIGRDRIDGGRGNDTYVFNLGDGQDTITDYDAMSNETNVVMLGQGIHATDIRIVRSGDNLVLEIGANGDQLTIENWVYGGRYAIDRLVFANGDAWESAQIDTIFLCAPIVGGRSNDGLYGVDSASNRMYGMESDDSLFGGALGDSLDGGEGNDSLRGGAGNDTQTGGRGNDRQDGDGGNDTYVFNIGDGQDTIADTGALADVDTLRLGRGISRADVTLMRDWSTLQLRFRNSSDSITFDSSNGRYGIERIVFEDEGDAAAIQIETLTASVNGSELGDSIDPWYLNSKVIDGFGGDDSMEGGGYEDTLRGGAGNDLLQGDYGNDVLEGGTGNDLLQGDDDNDVLEGGAGNDLLQGGDDSDTYIFNVGDGQDVIDDDYWNDSGVDVLRFGTGISSSNGISVTRVGGSLVLKVNGGEDCVTLKRGIERVAFADNAELTYAQVVALAQSSTNVGTSGDDILSGWGWLNDTMQGLEGNDTLTATAGADILTGGSGNDYLSGGDGNDTYTFARGDGQDTIAESGSGSDTLRLVGVSANDIAIGTYLDTVVLTINGSTDRITFNGWWSRSGGINSAGAIESFVFDGNDIRGASFINGLLNQVIAARASDDVLYGTYAADTLNGQAGNDTLYGNRGNDTLIGGTGDDSLYGSVGNDKYLFNRGDGRDFISDYDTLTGNSDVIEFGAGITADDLLFERSGLNLVVKFRQGNDQLTISNWGAGGAEVIERLVFANGTDLDVAKIMARLPASTINGSPAGDVLSVWASESGYLRGLAGNDKLLGNRGNDTLDGGDDYDTLYGEMGDDLLLGGAGWGDTLNGDAGNDTLQGEVGTDFLFGGEGSDTYVFNLGDGTDYISDYGARGDVDTIKFGVGIEARNISATYTSYNNTLTLKFSNSSDTLVIMGWGLGQNPVVERIVLADGSEWSSAMLSSLLPSVPVYSVEVEGVQRDLTRLGSAGNDSLVGSYGNDTLSGGEGDDTLRGNSTVNSNLYDADTLTGGSGGDGLYGGNGSDLLNGEADIDYLAGGEGNDFLSGGTGDDRLFGENGNDTLSGGYGSDALDGGSGDDVYLFNRGTGSDSVSDASGVNTLRFAVGINPEELLLSRSGNALVVRLASSTDQMTLLNWANGSVERFVFADGTEWSAADVSALLPSTNTGTADVDALFLWYKADGTLQGLGGNDTLEGSRGRNTLEGGLGNDYLRGDIGNDVYQFNIGDGQDTIYDAGDVDTIVFGAGIMSSNVVITHYAGGLILKINGETDRIAIYGWDDNTSTQYWIERFVFADGTIWDGSYVNARALSSPLVGGGANDTIHGWDAQDTLQGLGGADVLYGDYGNDTLEGGAGNDLLFGEEGSDTYVFNVGDGQDTIDQSWDRSGTDVLSFGSGIGVGQVSLSRSGADLVFKIAGGSDQVTLRNWAGNDGISRILFDGVELGRNQFYTLEPTLAAVTGTANADYIYGWASLRNDLHGAAGNDSLRGSNIEDTLEGGLGNDTLNGYGGNNTYLFNAGDGVDTISWYDTTPGNTSKLVFGVNVIAAKVKAALLGSSLVLTFDGNTDRIEINEWTGTSRPVDRIYFSNGNIEWNADQIDALISPIQGTSGADWLFGWRKASVIRGLDGADDLYAGSGNDTLEGGAGGDWMRGGAGDNVLEGGTGNDRMYGGGGKDTFIFNLGDGQDTISSNASTLRLGAGIAAADVRLARQGSDVVLTINGRTDEIVFWNWGSSDANPLDRIDFNGTTVWDAAQISAWFSGPVDGTSQSEWISGWETGEYIRGLDGNDSLVGYGGDDTLEGGVGNEYLSGGSGNDTYVFNLGDGVDTISSSAALPVETDVLRFGAGIDPDDIVVSQNYGYLILSIGDTGDAIWLGGWSSGDTYPLKRIVFAGGAEWNAAHIAALAANLQASTAGNDRLLGWQQADTLDGMAGDDILDGQDGNDLLSGGAGNDYMEGQGGNDTLSGGTGNDTLVGGYGSDTYLFQRGDGQDYVDVYSGYYSSSLDTIQLGAGIAAADLYFGRSGDYLVVGLLGTADRMHVSNWLIYRAQLRLEDGTIIILDESLPTTPMDGAETGAFTLGSGQVSTTGSDGVQVIHFEGNEAIEELRATSPLGLRLTGNRLDNRLIGNDGNDTLDGNSGADRMLGSDGSDEYIVDNAGDVVTEYANEGTDTVQSSVNYILGTNIENLTLTGGSGLAGTGNGLSNTLTGTNYDDTLTGAAGNDTLIGGTGYDTLVGGAGDDSYYVGTPETYFDVVVEAADEGIDTVYSEASANLSANVENLVLTGNTAIYASGNDLANMLTGNVADNVFWGYGGDDTLIGGAGNDRYFVDDAGDVVVEKAGEGVDTVLTSVDYTLSDQVENMEAGWSAYAPIRLTGNALSNRIDGGSYADTLDGGLGADTLVGGYGNDTYLVDNAGDVVTETGNQGTDLVLANVTVTALAANVENLTLTGTAALNGTGNTLNNTLLGNAASNQLYGGAGYDTLDGGAGADRLEGGADNDTYLVGDALDTLIELAGQGTDTVKTELASYTLLSNFENLILTGSAASTGIGNELGNVLTGNGAANRLEGRAGNDTLDGGAGQDDMLGGAGDDTYVVDNALDRVTELASEGTDAVRSAVAWTLGANLENLIMTGSALNGYGNALNNVLTGNSSANRLEGYTGNDTLDGGGGNDTLLGGIGDDTYLVDSASDIVTELAGEGTDTVVSSSSSYTLTANVENLKLESFQYAYSYRTATGNALNNTIEGNAYMNILDGGAGADVLKGGNGDDRYVVDNQADQVIELAGEGADTVASSVSITVLANNIENLELSGSAAINGSGNSLNNYLGGNSGNNILDGLAGNDTLAGAAGSDTYRLGIGGGVDTISDYRYTVTDINTLEVAVTDTQVTVSNVGEALRIGINGTSDAAVLENWFWGTNHQLNQIKFSNGVTWTPEQVEAHFVVANASASSDVIYGSIGNDAVLNGLGGNDTLYGRAGNDTLNGGLGDDALSGGEGADTYVISGFGQGRDIVNGDTLDTLRFAGINLAQATIERGDWWLDNEGSGDWYQGNGLGLRISVGSDATRSEVIINGFFAEDGSDGGRIGSVQFDNGSLSFSDLKTRISALSTAGNDVLYGFGSTESIDGGAGDDNIHGNGGADTLIGGLGNDYLEGTGMLDGGAGNDTLQVMYAYTTDAVHLVGGEGDDQLNGGYSYAAAPRTLEGGRGNDNLQVNGNGQNTVIYRTGDGKDTVSFADTDHNDILRFDGLQKADLAFVRSGSNLVIANLSDPEQQQVRVQSYFGSNPDNNRPANIEVLDGATYRSLSVAEVLALAQAGSPLADTIYGTTANEVLHGYLGNDMISGADGNDTLYGDDGNDTLYGQNGDDRLEGGTGNDTLDGGAGNDMLLGGQGDDYYYLYGSDAVIEAAGEGIDSVQAYSLSTYTLGANIENAIGAATLIGNEMDNVLTAGYGTTFDGAGGNDHYIGSWYGDTYRFAAGSGQDTVTDQQSWDSDYDQSVDQVAFGDGLAVDQIWFEHSGNDLRVSRIGSTDRLTIEGWYLPQDMDNRVEQFVTADGKVLLDSQVETLVQAMAAFAPPAAGQMTLPPAYQTALAPVVAANWH